MAFFDAPDVEHFLAWLSSSPPYRSPGLRVYRRLVMIRIFNHWVRRPTFAKLTLDVGFAALITTAIVSQNRSGSAVNAPLLAFYLIILAATAMVLSLWLSSYFRRDEKNDASAARGRVVLSIYLAVPVALSLIHI